ncbi:Hypothetical predicted protein [Xyrichtys novacula]|uniref:Uncharacterized protein n=1 Tax=Xyrichtys novacula TaxID=13765 RepID=A0AAV1GYN8_XYRNO|nr:Hypothetical predicted protein [Xyrichtys novacula]
MQLAFFFFFCYNATSIELSDMLLPPPDKCTALQPGACEIDVTCATSDKEAKLKRCDTRGPCECNLSASEGHCRHIYSVCHEETYFSPACGITSYQSLSSVTESFSQQSNNTPSLNATPSPIREFLNVKFHYR